MNCVQNRRIVRIVDQHADRRYIVWAEYERAIRLRNLLRYQVPKDREFRAEVVINAENFFPNIRRNVIATDETIAIVRRWEDAAILTTCGQQRLGVGVQKSGCYRSVVKRHI